MRYNNHSVLEYDFTFWLPNVSHCNCYCLVQRRSNSADYVQALIFSCLEIDFAIISASIPIFWPAIKTAWSQITVTREVIVISESRYDDTHKDDLELAVKSTLSLKTHKSTDSLVAGEIMDGKSFYVNTQPEPRKLQVLPSTQKPRLSWGGTPLKG